jgi:copper chaperone
MDWIINVKGMTCTHCKASVEGALAALSGVNFVNVDLDTGDVTVNIEEGQVEESAMKAAVEAIGFEVS